MGQSPQQAPCTIPGRRLFDEEILLGLSDEDWIIGVAYFQETC